ncbi:NADH-quinone oxidoreductase subunit NuoN [Rhodococcus sp. X156]|uniref:NADH-quinone oxidoreductase subunit NuoN n=1 Tax=Rhodococcus sp. X156 TaxID=2499145 RepID=UPI000FDA2534|nr:NADH-quinone oxidoreductase subunit NuoN [Rhodococcus sp. X156]
MSVLIQNLPVLVQDVPLTQHVLAQETVQAPSVDYAAISPLLVLLAAACLGVLVEAFVPRSSRWAAQVGLSLAALVTAGVALALHASASGRTDVQTLAGTLTVDRPALFLWGSLLVLAAAAVLLIADRSVEPGGAFLSDVTAGTVQSRQEAGARSTHTEVFPLTLFSLAGMMAFVAANDLLTMFVALEVLSLPLYLLCGLARRRQLLSQEAALKYFLLGAFASAIFLYGLALLYGYAGSVRLADIATAASGTDRSDILLFAGLAMLLVGLCFKASIGPFHTWTPDVYQGAPTPVTALMAACTKVAAFGALLRVLHVGFAGVQWDWRPVMWAVAIISMVVGTIIGITQTDMKRLIAYSSVAHAGFILVGTIAITPDGLSATLFYLLVYGLTVIAALGVVTLVRDSRGEAAHLSQWSGLGRRSPLVAGIFAFLMLSLAGIPLTGGFIAKFGVFSAGLQDGMAPLVVVGVLMSAVAAFFYLRVIVLMFFSEPAVDGPTVTVPGVFTTVAVGIGFLGTLVLGVVPGPVLDLSAVQSFMSSLPS